VRIFSAKERQHLISLCEAKIAVNKNFIQLREKDNEICKMIGNITGIDPSRIVNVEEILLELSKQTAISK
jgi:hypothetical protein